MNMIHMNAMAVPQLSEFVITRHRDIVYICKKHEYTSFIDCKTQDCAYHAVNKPHSQSSICTCRHHRGDIRVQGRLLGGGQKTECED